MGDLMRCGSLEYLGLEIEGNRLILLLGHCAAALSIFSQRGGIMKLQVFLAFVLLVLLVACGTSQEAAEVPLPTDADEPTRPLQLSPTQTPTQAPTPSSDSDSEPYIDAQPATALADEVVKIQVGGLAPGQTVTLRASLRDDRSQRWESYATFLSDRSGIVDVSTQAPISGTYSIADPMGLFWSMLPKVPGNESPAFENYNTYFIQVIITAEIDDEQVATAYIKRIRLQQDVNRVRSYAVGGGYAKLWA